MRDGQIIRPVGHISTIAEVNEAQANRYPVDYGYRGDEPKRTWDGDDFVPSEPTTLEPVAAFVAVVEGLEVAVDGSASFDEDSPEVAAPLVFEWTWGDNASSTGSTATHTYVAPGTYEITLLVTDASGAMGQISQTVTVAA